MLGSLSEADDAVQECWLRLDLKWPIGDIDVACGAAAGEIFVLLL
jgi:hypothetical protein